MLKLLVPVDGSDTSLRAIEHVIKMGGAYKDSPELHVINVQPPMPFGSRVSSAIGHDAVEKYHREEGLKALQGAVQKLDAAGVKYAQHICVGEPAEIAMARHRIGTRDIRDILDMGVRTSDRGCR